MAAGRTLFPRYCKLRSDSVKSINCFQCSLLTLLAQTRIVKVSSLVIAGPQAEKSMCRNVGFIVCSAVSLMYIGSAWSQRAIPNKRAKSTYQPSMPATCRLKKTSAIRSPVTFSSFSCLPCGVAWAHSRVLLLRIRKLGRGGVRSSLFNCFPLPLAGLPFACDSFAPSVAAALLKSVELRECSNVLFSRNAIILAGDLRVCGTASSSMVLVRRRVWEDCSRETLRMEIETKFRSLRF